MSSLRSLKNVQEHRVKRVTTDMVSDRVRDRALGFMDRVRV